MKIKKVLPFIILSLFVISCNNKTTNTIKTKNQTSQSSENRLNKRYMEEGFIKTDTFRVVIVATQKECINNKQQIKQRAKNRTLLLLKKYILFKFHKFNPSSKTKLLNLIGAYGKFSQGNNRCGKNNIFYFDIVNTNLKQHLKNISSDAY